MYSDCVRIEKSTGKPDLFSMNAAQARYILSLVGVLKEQSSRRDAARFREFREISSAHYSAITTWR